MQSWKIRDAVAIAVATVGSVVLEFLDPRIERAVNTALFGLIAIIIILIWPEKVKEKKLVDPKTAKMMETAELLKQHFNIGKKFEESLKEMGWKEIEVERLKWPWSGDTARWNSETCEWDYE